MSRIFRTLIYVLVFSLPGSASPVFSQEERPGDRLLTPTLVVDEVVARAAVNRAEEIFDSFDDKTGDLNHEIFGDWERKLYLSPGLQVIVNLNDPYNSLVDYSYELLQRGEKPGKMIPLLVDRGEEVLGLVRFKGLIVSEAPAALPEDLTLILEDDRGSTFSPLPGTHRIVPAGKDKYFFWTSFGHVEQIGPAETDLEPIIKPGTRWLKLLLITSHERKDLVWRFKTEDF